LGYAASSFDAIENMSYVVAVNRIGSDANAYEYMGHSQVLDFLGEYVWLRGNRRDFYSHIRPNKINETRTNYLLNDQDSFEIRN
jgi:predicted amidohydrolase